MSGVVPFCSALALALLWIRFLISFAAPCEAAHSSLSMPFGVGNGMVAVGGEAGYVSSAGGL
ncbi:hypothetical protein BDW74DRAFT_83793 [Aspergillus multicolor]|uniref:uncharacterized protein n=1 Tax=Aspergillus multicolor TaxID=41759 RepID=UPI003CCCAFF1